MSHPPAPGIDRYRELWLEGAAPSLETYLADRTTSPQEFSELLILDQSLRWSAGTHPEVADYVARFPALLENRSLLIDLVYAEHLWRERWNLPPTADRYMLRFPEIAEELQQQISFHVAMDAVQDEAADDDFAAPAGPDALDSGPPDISGYRRLQELGRGGTGVVYQATDIQLGRPVAIKMLLSGQFASASQLRRFLLEAEATARLQHPNIVQIYEVGQHQGYPYLALEFINGGNLSQWIQRHPLPARRAAALVQTLATATEFAHQQGVIHRDLKPENILIQLASGSLSRSLNRDLSSLDYPQQLKIADFGLAKLTFESRAQSELATTRAGDVLGTLAYMSPEQAKGDTTCISPATDVYSLGAILYELLTGRAPFVGLRPMEALAQVISEPPIPPAQLVREVPLDLQTICLKSLQKSPNQRYATARELADDLGRFLIGDPVVARKTPALVRGWRWCRRHRVTAAVILSLAMVMVIATVFSTAYSWMLKQQLSITSEAKDKEQAARRVALQQLWEARLAQADAIRSGQQTGQRLDALAVIDSARQLGPPTDFLATQVDRMRNATVACLTRSDLQLKRGVPGKPPSSFSLMALDARHHRYATREGPDQVLIRDIESGRAVLTIPDAKNVTQLLFSLDGNRLAVVNQDCRVYSLDSQHAQLIFHKPSRGAWDLSPNGKQIMGTSDDGLLCLFNLNDGTVDKSFPDSEGTHEIRISADARLAAMTSGPRLQVIQLETGMQQLAIEQTALLGRANLAWHPSSRCLAVGPSVSGAIQLWDVESGVCVKSFESDTGELRLQFNSFGDQLFAYDAWSCTFQLWNVCNGKLEMSSVGIVADIASNSGGGFDLLHLSEDGIFGEFEILHSRIYATLPLLYLPSSRDVTSGFTYSLDGRLLAVLSHGVLQVFETDSLQLLDHVVCGPGYIRFSPDGSLLTSTAAGFAKWKLASSRGDLTIGPPLYLSDLVAYSRFDVSQDGRYAVVSTGSQMAIQYLDSPKPPRQLGSQRDIRRLAVHPDGSQVISGGWEGGDACVWNVSTGELMHTFSQPNCCLVDYSPDGKWIVTNSDRVRMWNATTWEPVAEFPVSGLSVSGVQTCFSPDSRLLAVSDSLAQIHLYDTRDGSELLILTDPNQDRATHLEFRPDGRQLAVLSGTQGSIVHVWDLAAIEEELTRRELDHPVTRLTSDSMPVDSKPAPEIVKSLRIQGDQKTREIEAERILEQLQKHAGEYDLIACRAAIDRLGQLQPTAPTTCNNLAWILATGPVPLRDPAAAVRLARTAFADAAATQEEHQLFINTLGVALYRDNQFAEAKQILAQSLAIQSPENRPYDLLFMSLCDARLGDMQSAQEHFTAAESIIAEFKDREMPSVWKRELSQFADEARQSLR